MEKGKRPDKEEALQKVNANLEVLNTLDIGEAGTMLFQIQGSAVDTNTTLLPKSLTGNMGAITSDSLKSSSWVNITPDWQ